MFRLRSFLLLVGLTGLLGATARAEELSVATRVADLITFLDVEDAGVRGRSAEELARFGPEARPAVKGLIRLLVDDRQVGMEAASPTVATCASNALVAIGSEAVESLQTALSVQSAEVRSRSAAILGKIGPKAVYTLPALLIAIRDPEEQVRVAAVGAIGRIDPETESVEPILSRSLQDPSAAVRATAADALGDLNGTSQDAERGLLSALRDAHPAVRARAAWALGRRGSSPETVVPALTQLLSDREWFPVSIEGNVDTEERVAVAAAEALGDFGAFAAPAGNVLLRFVTDPSDSVRQRSAAATLVALGSEAGPLLPALRVILDRPGTESDIRQVVLDVYRRLGPVARGEIDGIRKLLMRPKLESVTDVDLSLAAACALVAIDGENNPEAWAFVVDELQRISQLPSDELQDGEPRLDLILETMLQVGTATPSGTAAVVRLFERRFDEGRPVNARLVRALTMIGPPAKLALGRAFSLLRRRQGDAEELAKAIVAIDPQEATRLRRLAADPADEDACLAILRAIAPRRFVHAGFGMKLVNHELPSVRVAVAERLGRDQTTQVMSAPILVGMLTDDRPAVREQAALSLAELKFREGQVIPALVSALKDDYIDVRAAAGAALGALAPGDDSVVAALQGATADPNPYVSEAAAKALAVLKPAPMK